MKIETRAVHAGRNPEGGSRDVVPAIHLSTTFHKADDGTLPGGYLYGRPNNPNRESLEHALASLEEGATALAFSSGSAATLAVFQALSPGDHVIAAEDAYYGTPILLRTVMANWGLKHTLVNMQDLAAVERAITPPHSGQTSELARVSYPHLGQRPARRRRAATPRRQVRTCRAVTQKREMPERPPARTARKVIRR